MYHFTLYSGQCMTQKEEHKYTVYGAKLMHCEMQEGMHVHVKDYRALANFSCPLLLWNELTQNNTI